VRPSAWSAGVLLPLGGGVWAGCVNVLGHDQDRRRLGPAGSAWPGRRPRLIVSPRPIDRPTVTGVKSHQIVRARSHGTPH
jgi:hypothetical protein